MLLCRVTLGKMQHGEPVEAKQQMVRRYDSLVFCERRIYVIFDNFRAYPEYLITYKKTKGGFPKHWKWLYNFSMFPIEWKKQENINSDAKFEWMKKKRCIID